MKKSIGIFSLCFILAICSCASTSGNDQEQSQTSSLFEEFVAEQIRRAEEKRAAYTDGYIEIGLWVFDETGRSRRALSEYTPGQKVFFEGVWGGLEERTFGESSWKGARIFQIRQTLHVPEELISKFSELEKFKTYLFYGIIGDWFDFRLTGVGPR